MNIPTWRGPLGLNPN